MTIALLIEGREGPIFTCGAEVRVRDAIGQLAQKRIGALPVLQDGSVIGIFSERDVIYRLESDGPAMLDHKVGDVMTSPAVTVAPETDVLTALALMTKRRIRHLPVMQDGVMVGLVSIGDLVKFRIERIETEAEAMRAYIQA